MVKKSLLPQIIEPLAIIALLALFIVPTLTVINLSPITQEFKKSNVLGVTNKDSQIVVEKIGGIHNIFSTERLEKQPDSGYLYITEIGRRKAGKIYSKPILTLENKSTKEEKFSFYGYTDSTAESVISIKINNETYVLKDNSNTPYTIEVTLKPLEKKTMYLYVEGQKDILFLERLTIVLSSK